MLPADPTSVHACTPGTSPVSARPTSPSAPSPLRCGSRYHAYAPELEDTTRLPDLSKCYDATFTGERTVASTYSIATYARLRVTMRTRFRWAPGEPWRNARCATYTWPETRMAREYVR